MTSHSSLFPANASIVATYAWRRRSRSRVPSCGPRAGQTAARSGTTASAASRTASAPTSRVRQRRLSETRPYGSSPPASSTPCPTDSASSSARYFSTASATSRLFPIPASPSRSRVTRTPLRALCTASPNKARSSSRPTKRPRAGAMTPACRLLSSRATRTAGRPGGTGRPSRWSCATATVGGGRGAAAAVACGGLRVRLLRSARVVSAAPVVADLSAGDRQPVVDELHGESPRVVSPDESFDDLSVPPSRVSGSRHTKREGSAGRPARGGLDDRRRGATR